MSEQQLYSGPAFVHRIDGAIKLDVSQPLDPSFTLMAQTLAAARITAEALRVTGCKVTISVWAQLSVAPKTYGYRPLSI